jgi:hypothetical protein
VSPVCIRDTSTVAGAALGPQQTPSRLFGNGRRRSCKRWWGHRSNQSNLPFIRRTVDWEA